MVGVGEGVDAVFAGTTSFCIATTLEFVTGVVVEVCATFVVLEAVVVARFSFCREREEVWVGIFSVGVGGGVKIEVVGHREVELKMSAQKRRKNCAIRIHMRAVYTKTLQFFIIERAIIHIRYTDVC